MSMDGRARHPQPMELLGTGKPNGAAPAQHTGRRMSLWFMDKKSRRSSGLAQAREPGAEKQACVLSSRWPDFLRIGAQAISDGGQTYVNQVQKVLNGLVRTATCGGCSLAQMDSATSGLVDIYVDCISVHQTKLDPKAENVVDNDLIGCGLEAGVCLGDADSEADTPPHSPRHNARDTAMTAPTVAPLDAPLTGAVVSSTAPHPTTPSPTPSSPTTPSPTQGQGSVSIGTPSPSQPQSNKDQSGNVLAASVSSCEPSARHASSREQQPGIADCVSSVLMGALSPAQGPSGAQQSGHAAMQACVPHDTTQQSGHAAMQAGLTYDLQAQATQSSTSSIEAQQVGLASTAVKSENAPVQASVPHTGTLSQVPQNSTSAIAIQQADTAIIALQSVVPLLNGSAAAAQKVAADAAQRKVPQRHLNSSRAEQSIAILQLLAGNSQKLADVLLYKEQQAAEIKGLQRRVAELLYDKRMQTTEVAQLRQDKERLERLVHNLRSSLKKNNQKAAACKQG